MCLAIYRPPGVDVPEDNLLNGWQRNSHGGGFAYYRKGKVRTIKGLMKWGDFLRAYRKAVNENPDAPFVIHFRITSQGAQGPDNTHPHIFEHGAMIHNGTLSGTGAVYGRGPSDTALFIDRFGKDLTYERTLAIKDQLGLAMPGNKLVFLYKNGKHVIINESSGSWINGVWYSNSYSLFPTRNTPSGPACATDDDAMTEYYEGLYGPRSDV